jgi:hypothetical protein
MKNKFPEDKVWKMHEQINLFANRKLSSFFGI